MADHLSDCNSTRLYALAQEHEAHGRAEQALDCYKQILNFEPTHIAGLTALGALLRKHGNAEASLVPFREVTRIAPADPFGFFNLGLACADLLMTDSAHACFVKTLELDPGLTDARFALGRLLMTMGMADRAFECFETVCAAVPGNQLYRSSLLFCSLHLPGRTAGELLEFHRQWERDTALCESGFGQWDNSPIAGRPLRVGYVSADFYRHPVAWFIEPVLQYHDQAAYTIVCYSDVVVSDSVTDRFKSLAGEWCDCSKMGNDELTNRICKDRIDILVDCGGHTSRGRLPVFGAHPAPVQVSWLGYPFSTGMQAMDYRIGDWCTDPQGAEKHYVEKLARLPGPFFCMQKPWHWLEPEEPPCVTRGVVTFGCTHRLSRLNDAVLCLWGRILQAVPNSRLLVFRDSIGKKTENALKARMERCGINIGNVDFGTVAPVRENLISVYRNIDISLDTFPWSGHTMACESLWSGVPVITIKGESHRERMVASLLESCGLMRWCVATTDEYVSVATSVAADSDNLARLRKSLPEILANAPVCDCRTFTVGLESLFREMWHTWCRARTGA